MKTLFLVISLLLISALFSIKADGAQNQLIIENAAAIEGPVDDCRVFGSYLCIPAANKTCSFYIPVYICNIHEHRSVSLPLPE